MNSPTIDVPADRFVADIEAAVLLGLSRGHLRTLRVVGGGPPFIKRGKAVRYRVPVLMDWMASKKLMRINRGWKRKFTNLSMRLSN